MKLPRTCQIYFFLYLYFIYRSGCLMEVRIVIIIYNRITIDLTWGIIKKNNKYPYFLTLGGNELDIYPKMQFSK